MFVARMPRLEARSPGRRSNVENAPRRRPVKVSWSLTSLFSTNMAISETKGQGWKVIRTQ